MEPQFKVILDHQMDCRIAFGIILELPLSVELCCEEGPPCPEMPRSVCR